ncbi:MAG: PTS-dependent dihydroxyacetone kinase phosphotransferase subunit DhaM, partial [Anaerolineae bacterium]|nr:PTS-dependent dihydroxyacetone kinase phosphotransferase subunit DhaM [Anaerolineae bacterium]
MVGIVLVSHSAELAAAVKALAEQQTQGRAAIAAVGGTGDPDHPFGTDAMAIMDAIQSVYHDDGVLVLMDLGSALLSAEMALEFMDPDQAARVQLSAAPFIEGAMAASVQASIGASLDAVAAEALDALNPKQESLGANDTLPTLATVTDEATEAGAEVSEVVTLINHAGLHFGPAVLFVQTAAGFQAEIVARNMTTNAGPANVKRFNQVLALGAEEGHDVKITASGADAPDALAALVSLARAGFGETEPAATSVENVARQTETNGRGRLLITGLAASAGVAVGKAIVLRGVQPVAERHTVDDPAGEWTRCQAALDEAHGELLDLAQRMARELGEQQARIFQAHALVLEDPDLRTALHDAITQQRLNAEAAVADVFGTEAVRYENMAGQRFQERAADLRDVAGRLHRLLRGNQPAIIELPDAAVIVAEDLAPSQTVALDRNRVVGFCTALGGPTAHT